MKTLIILFLLFFLNLSCSAQTLKGGVEFTVDSARLVAFDNVPVSISKNEFEEHLRDNFYYSSMGYINGEISESVARKVVPFYEKNKLSFYGVQYDKDPQKKYYYSPSGKLLKYETNTSKGVYPYKTMAYDPQGRLLNINLVVSKNEAFIFNKNKKLMAHWIDDKCYNENGKIILTKRL